MRAATHRCGEVGARQSDFPPRNHSIPHHPFPFLHPRSISLSPSTFAQLLSPFGSLFLFRFSAFLPRTPFHPFTSVFVAFSPRSLRPVRAYVYIYTLSISSLSPFHLIRSSTTSESAENGSPRVYPHALTHTSITRTRRL